MTEIVEVRVRGDEIVGYRCEGCGEVYTVSANVSLPQVRVRAEHCCNWTCHKCGVPCQKHWTLCSACEKKVESAQRQKEFETALVVKPEEYAGAVYYDGDTGTPERDFYENLGEFLSDMETFLVGYFDDVDDGEEPPPLEPFFVWCCTEKPFRLNAKEVVAQFLEQGEHHDDAYEAIAETSFYALQSMLDSWCDGVDLKTFYVDRTRLVMLDEVYLRRRLGR